MKNIKTLKVILTCGAPASGKSTWAKQEVAKDPTNWARINNDDIRAMLNAGVYSAEYEKLVSKMRNTMVREALSAGKNVIIDNVNSNRRHFEDTVKLCKSISGTANIIVYEKAFFEPLATLIDRDKNRAASVGEEVIKKFWKALGGVSHKHYNPRTEVITNIIYPKLCQDESLPKSLIIDLDGTISIFNKIGNALEHENVHFRNQYDASRCDEDGLNKPVAEVVYNFYEKGYSMLFCSGRKKDYETQTRKFIETHFPEMKYQLFMRSAGDNRSDDIVKEELFRDNIENKYNVLFILDDRKKVVDRWRSMGLTCFQVCAGDF